MIGLSVFAFVLVIGLAFSIFIKGLPDLLRTFFHYLYLVRIPLIGGGILLLLPIIAEWVAPQFLQNIFVMESNVQLAIVIVFATVSSISIVSLFKNILVETYPHLDNKRIFLSIKMFLTLAFCAPVWYYLALNSLSRNPEPKLSWNCFNFAFLFSLIWLVFLFIYDWREYLPFIKKKVNSKNAISKISKTKGIKPFVGLTIYVLTIILNWPQPNAQTILADEWQSPSLLYVLLIVWIITLVIGELTEEIDRRSLERYDDVSKKDLGKVLYTFRLPIIVILITLSALSYAIFGVDHYFKLQESSVTANYDQDFTTAVKNRLCQNYLESNNQSCRDTLVVVAASGGGIQASGWTTEVLSGLQQEIGEDFTKSIGLISSASGGSVGTMFYLDKLEDGILKNKQTSQELIKNATDDWLDSVTWGLAFPDLLRLVGYPISSFVRDGIYLDRGYSLEKDWQRTLSKPNLTLDDWYNKAKTGEIPIPVFNSTIVENGRRFLISPMKFIPSEMKYYADSNLLEKNQDISEEDKLIIKQSKAFDFRTLYNNCGNPEPLKAGNKPCTINVTTASRLSATFPYVSPMARNDIHNTLIDSQGKEIKDHEDNVIVQNYHMADGGYFDNAGAFTAIEWLDRLLEKHNDELGIKKVLLIQINAFPEDILETQQIGEKGFITVGLGPINALNGVRNSTQVARNIEEVGLLKKRWGNDIKIEDFAFTFPKKDENENKYNQPLSWRLTQRQKNNLKQAWQNDQTIENTLKSINKFWNEHKT